MMALNPTRIAVLYASAMLAGCLLVGLLVPPALFNDLAAGWQVWTSMQAGAPFNSIWTAAHQNLARNEALFLPGWSPGHYLVPAFFTMLGLSFGQAVTVAGVLGNALGLAGFWRLWRAWSMPIGVMAASVIVTASSRVFGEIVGTAGRCASRWTRSANPSCAASHGYQAWDQQIVDGFAFISGRHL